MVKCVAVDTEFASLQRVVRFRKKTTIFEMVSIVNFTKKAVKCFIAFAVIIALADAAPKQVIKLCRGMVVCNLD